MRFRPTGRGFVMAVAVAGTAAMLAADQAAQAATRKVMFENFTASW